MPPLGNESSWRHLCRHLSHHEQCLLSFKLNVDHPVGRNDLNPAFQNYSLDKLCRRQLVGMLGRGQVGEANAPSDPQLPCAVKFRWANLKESNSILPVEVPDTVLRIVAPQRARQRSVSGESPGRGIPAARGAAVPLSFEVRRGRPGNVDSGVGFAQMRVGTRVVRHSPESTGKGLPARSVST